MSAIASLPTIDTPQPRLGLTAKTRGGAAQEPGIAGKFSDLLGIGSASIDTAGPLPVAAETGDADKADALSAVVPGNLLPMPLPMALPVLPAFAPPPQPVPITTSTSAIAVAVSTVTAATAGAPSLPSMDQPSPGITPMAMNSDMATVSPLAQMGEPTGGDERNPANGTTSPVPAPVTAATNPTMRIATLTPRDQDATAPRATVPNAALLVSADVGAPLVTPIDTAMVDALTPAAAPARDGAMPSLPPTAQGFRLVVAQPQPEMASAEPAGVAPALPSGPLTVRQATPGAPVIGLLANTLRSLANPSEKADDVAEKPAVTLSGPVDPAALGAVDSARPVVPTTAAGDSRALDMTQHHWPQAMIDRIDRMREDAATADSRIQLSPDVLGGIAVAIRRDDDRTHIHFTAEQSQTATMLADAHATLARLAEDKGMRLGSMTANAGAPGGSDLGQPTRDQRPATPPAPAVPTRPRASDTDPFRDGATGLSAATASTRIA